MMLFKLVPLRYSTIKRLFDFDRLLLAGSIDCSQRAMSNHVTDITQKRSLLSILENNPKRFERIKFLSALFEADGFELRIAGGAVRDILRGVEPQDIDFATTARPEQSLTILKKHENLLRIIVTASGQKHGTVAVKFKEGNLNFKKVKLNSGQTSNVECDESREIVNDILKKPEYDSESPFEITTLRYDRSTDGRHAEVVFTNDWRIDAERRDLTINAMFLTLDEGKLIDYFNGEQDLKCGTLRFVGNADSRLMEDYLRILRYFRFWSRYGQSRQPDPETISAVERNLVGLNKISGERLWSETKKIFGHLPCHETTKMMLDLRLFEHLGMIDTNLKDYDSYMEDTLNDLKKAQTNVEIYSKEYLNQSSHVDSDDNGKIRDLLPVILFASTVKTSDMFTSIYKRMKFSNLERDLIMYIMDHRFQVPELKTFQYELVMAPGSVRHHLQLKIRAFLIYSGKFEYINELKSWQIPNFPITGHMVMEAIEKRKVPHNQIKAILEKLKKRWVDSDYKIPKEVLEQEMRTIINGTM